MTREVFLARLSYMEDYHAVPDEFYDTIKYKRKHPKNYSVATDPRFASRYLEYASSKDQGNAIFLTYISFSIAANLSLSCLQQPSNAELKEMLKIAGYTPEQMEQYIMQRNGIEPEQVPVPRLQSVVFLLTHAIEDAISDRSEWRRRKRYEENHALKRLQALTAYMEEKELIELDDWMAERAGNSYEFFVLRHADNILKRQVVAMESDEAFRLVKARVDQIESIRDKEVRKIMQSPGKRSFAPLANPAAAPTTQDLAALMQSANNGTFSIADVDKMIEQRKASMPLEAKAVMNRAEEEFNKMSSAFDKVLEKTDDMRDKLITEAEEQMRVDYLPSVAVGAFRAIVAGEDEIFKLTIGRYIWQDFMTQSTIPLSVLSYEELEDEGEWDEIAVEDNGRLGLKVYNEDDLATVSTTSVAGMEKATLPLSALLSKYAYRIVPTSLYIRKSYIKLFKDLGFSERRARDFAVMMATLASMDRIESANYMLPYENLYDFGDESEVAAEKIEEEKKEKKETPKEPTVEKMPEADGRAEELEKALKQARKANQTCRHEIGVLEREVERLKGLLEEKHAVEAVEAVETVEVEEDDDAEETVSEEKIEFPYHTKLRVVVYGGFDVFHRELLKLIPDVRIIEPASRVDVRPLRNADIVFLQINKTDHSNYWAVCDACKNSGVPYIHLNYASARRCAEVMVTEIKKIEK